MKQEGNFIEITTKKRPIFSIDGKNVEWVLLQERRGRIDPYLSVTKQSRIELEYDNGEHGVLYFSKCCLVEIHGSGLANIKWNTRFRKTDCKKESDLPETNANIKYK